MSKVFEVTIEDFSEDTNEITTTVQYVTSADDSISTVTDNAAKHCEQYERELKGVREILVISEHLTPTKE